MNVTLITTTELSKILGISDRTIRKAIAAGKIKAKKVGRKYEVFIPSLDKNIQEKIKQKYYNNLNVESYPICTEEEKKIALSKFDLFLQWQQFFQKYKGTKIDSIKDFISLYRNKGNKYAKINKISVVTMLRWEKKLKESDYNWQSLLPKYNSVSKSSQLTQLERDTFLGLLLHPNQTNIGKAIKLTKHILAEKGIHNTSSEMTFRRFAKKYIQENYDLWVFAREGSKALKDKVLPYVERDISKLEVGDVIVGDGHRLAFQVINPFTGKPCRPTLVAYQDWKSGGLVGFEIMLEENTQCIASALRNAIINLGRIPRFVYQDNGKAFKAKYFTEAGIAGLFVKLGITPIFALPYNAKAKVIERFFREMQDSFERLLPSFVGSCIDNQPAYMKRNEKFHKNIHNNYIPKISEVIDLIEKWLCFHYAQPCPNVEGKSIGQVLEEGKGYGINIEELDDLMMAIEIKNIGRNGIKFLKQNYYDEILYGYRDKVIIKYSLFDLSEIKVYTIKGEFLCIAKRLEPINPLANYIGDAKDIEELRQRLKQQKRLEEKTVKMYLSGMKSKKDYYLPFSQERDLEEYKPIDAQVEYIKTFIEAEEAYDTPKVFHNRYEKYEYLKSKTVLTEEENIWLKSYETSDEYELIYGI